MSTKSARCMPNVAFQPDEVRDLDRCDHRAVVAIVARAGANPPAPFLHGRPKANSLHVAHAVGREIDAGPDLAKLRRLLVHLDRQAVCDQRVGGEQPADAATDDRHLGPGFHWHCSMFSFPFARSARPAMVALRVAGSMLTAPRKRNKICEREKGLPMSYRDLPRIASALAVALSLLLGGEHGSLRRPRSRWRFRDRRRRSRCRSMWRRRRDGSATSRSRRSTSPATPTPCGRCCPAMPTSRWSARSTCWPRSTPAPRSAPSIPGSRSATTVSCWRPARAAKLADLAGKTFATSGPGALPDQLPRAGHAQARHRRNRRRASSRSAATPPGCRP